MVKTIIFTLVFFTLIVLTGLTVGSLTYYLTRRILYTMVVVQATFFMLSTIIIFYVSKGRLGKYGFKVNFHYSILSFLTSLGVAFPLSLVSTYFSKGFSPRILSENFYGVLFVSLFLAPVGEETLFRGLLEGYLLEKGGRKVAVIFPAILFSLIHVLPYYRTPLTYLILLLVNAFILSIVAGYFRLKSSSLVPAYLTHATFNLVGMVIWLF